jgi:hypothetical protein
MKRTFYMLAILVAVAAVTAGSLVAQANPFVGTWKLDVAKSKYEGAPAPKSLTRTVTAEGAGLKYSFAGVAADGSKIAYSFTSNLDGKDAAVSGVGMAGGADTITLMKLSASKTEGVSKKGGAEIGTAKTEVSADGKTTTVTTVGKLDGKEVKAVAVYEKQ